MTQWFEPGSPRFYVPDPRGVIHAGGNQILRVRAKDRSGDPSSVSDHFPQQGLGRGIPNPGSQIRTGACQQGATPAEDTGSDPFRMPHRSPEKFSRRQVQHPHCSIFPPYRRKTPVIAEGKAIGDRDQW